MSIYAIEQYWTGDRRGMWQHVGFHTREDAIELHRLYVKRAAAALNPQTGIADTGYDFTGYRFRVVRWKRDRVIVRASASK